MALRNFKALVSEKGRDDFGASGMTFEVDQLIKDKIYTQIDTTYWDAHAKASPPFIVDDNGCSRNIKDMISSGKLQEIFD